MWLVMVTSYATLQSKAGDDEAHLQRGCEPGVTMIDLPPAGQGRLQHFAFRHVAHAFLLVSTTRNIFLDSVSLFHFVLQEVNLRTVGRYGETEGETGERLNS